MKGGERNAAPDSRAVQTKVRELRSVSFSPARRGLDRDEVMTYLHRLAAWLESAGLADPEEVRRELAMVGQRTSEILTKADETANALRSESQRNAGELLQSARTEADRIRAEAEEETRDARAEARDARAEAEARAEETLEEADRRAERMIDEAVKRRQDLEVVIDDLVAGRDEILADARRLIDELGALVGRDDDERPADDEEAGEPEATDEGAPDEGAPAVAEIDDDEFTGEMDGEPDFSVRDRVEEFEDDEPAGGEPDDLAEPDTEEHSPERTPRGAS